MTRVRAKGLLLSVGVDSRYHVEVLVWTIYYFEINLIRITSDISIKVARCFSVWSTCIFVIYLDISFIRMDLEKKLYEYIPWNLGLDECLITSRSPKSRPKIEL